MLERDGLLPLFDAYSRIGLYDTHLGMIIVYTAISIPFSAFVMRNFFTGVAHSVFEAAVLDGATTWRIFLRVYLPIASSALVAIFILQATFIWNDLLLGLTLSQSDNVRPIVTTLAGMQSTYGGAQISTVLAAAVLVSLPTVILFLFTQKFFARGLALGQYLEFDLADADVTHPERRRPGGGPGHSSLRRHGRPVGPHEPSRDGAGRP